MPIGGFVTHPKTGPFADGEPKKTDAAYRPQAIYVAPDPGLLSGPFHEGLPKI